MNPEHFPYQPGDPVTLLTYTDSGQAVGDLVEVDDYGVTLHHKAHGLLVWRPWSNIAGASAKVPSSRVAEVMLDAARRTAHTATGAHPVATLDTPPPA